MSQVLFVGGFDIGGRDRTTFALLKALEPKKEYQIVFVEEVVSLEHYDELITEAMGCSNFRGIITKSRKPGFMTNIFNSESIKPEPNRGPPRSRNARKVW